MLLAGGMGFGLFHQKTAAKGGCRDASNDRAWKHRIHQTKEVHHESLEPESAKTAPYRGAVPGSVWFVLGLPEGLVVHAVALRIFR